MKQIYRNDYMQLLIDSQSDDFNKDHELEQTSYDQVRFEKKLTFDVII